MKVICPRRVLNNVWFCKREQDESSLLKREKNHWQEAPFNFLRQPIGAGAETQAFSEIHQWSHDSAFGPSALDFEDFCPIFQIGQDGFQRLLVPSRERARGGRST